MSRLPRWCLAALCALLLSLLLASAAAAQDDAAAALVPVAADRDIDTPQTEAVAAAVVEPAPVPLPAVTEAAAPASSTPASDRAAGLRALFGAHPYLYPPSWTPAEVSAAEAQSDLLALAESADCVDMDPNFIPLNGRCNNRWGHPDMGSLPQRYLRIIRANYPDGSGAAQPNPPVNPRRISELVFEQGSVGDKWDERGLSNWVVEFGQLFNHEKHLNGASSGVFHPIEDDSIPVIQPDSAFSAATIPNTRSEFARGTGVSPAEPRVPINVGSTAWIDASPLYGVTAALTSLLRGENGEMRTRQMDGGEFPMSLADLPLPGQPPVPTFMAFGDGRGNEQIGLALMQTLWVREHNYHARRLRASSPSLGSDELFLRARRLVIAEVQKVTLDWFAAFGCHVGEYPGYTGRDPNSVVEFVTGAMRAGHSQISDQLLALELEVDESASSAGSGAAASASAAAYGYGYGYGREPVPARLRRHPTCGRGAGGDTLTLAESFFQPQQLYPSGCPEAFSLGLAHSPCQAVDIYCHDAVRNLLFGAGSGLDLLAIDVQREYDQGVSGYARVRQALGLGTVSSLDDITDDPKVKERLARAFTLPAGTAVEAPPAQSPPADSAAAAASAPSASVPAAAAAAAAPAPSSASASASVSLSSVDLLTGGLAEKHVRGASLGPTFLRLFEWSLEQMRSSDRHWFERVGSLSANGAEDAALREMVFNTDLGDIVARNTNLDRRLLPKNIFFTDARRTTYATLMQAEATAAAAAAAAAAQAGAFAPSAAASVAAAALAAGEGVCTDCEAASQQAVLDLGRS